MKVNFVELWSGEWATSENTNRQERVAGLNVRSATIQRRVSPAGQLHKVHYNL